MAFLKSLLSFIFGRPSWIPPTWLRWLWAKLAVPPWRAAMGLRASRPRVFWGALVGVLALSVAGGALTVWYRSRPKPVEFTVEATAPALTQYPKDEDRARIAPLAITFGTSAARLEHVGKVVEEGVTLDPPIPGQWRWVSASNLQFEPGADWAPGREYEVKLDPSLLPDHVRLERYEVPFTTPAFEASIPKSEFFIDPRDPKIRKVVATLKFTHPVDPASLEKRVALAWDESRPIPFRLEYNSWKTEAYLHSESITLPGRAVAVQLVVRPGVADQGGSAPFQRELKTPVEIPGMYEFFRVKEVGLKIARDPQDRPEQVLLLEMTSGADPKALQARLKAWMLPVDRPPIPGRDDKIVKNHFWSDESEVGPEVLALSTPVPLQPIPAEEDAPRLHGFKLDIPPSRYLYIALEKGLEGHGGFLLGETFTAIFDAPDYPKEAKVLHDGSLLSLGGDRRLSVVARGLKALRVEVSRVLPGEVNHLVTQSGGDFQSPYFHNWKFSEDNISRSFQEIRTLRELPPGESQYAAVDLGSYLARERQTATGLFFLKVEGWNPQSKSAEGREDRRFVLLTDMGLLVKGSEDGSKDVFVQSISKGRPVDGATVEVLGKNGLPLLARRTGADGHAAFPPLSEFKREQEPVAILVRKGADLSFLPFDRSDRQMDFSRFDVGGVYDSSQDPEGALDAYLFSDRGIYRPGERFHMGVVIRPKGFVRRKLEGIPLELITTDPRGLTVKREKITLPASGFLETDYLTEAASPTGPYTVTAYVIKDDKSQSQLGSGTVRVEEFVPDRMKVTAQFSLQRAEGWITPDGLKANITLRNLFGTPAADRRVRGELTLTPAFPSFRNYKDYSFFDPLKAKQSFSEAVVERITDENGEAQLSLDLGRFEKATYRLALSVEAFEAEGGRSVSTEISTLVSPLQYLVGHKADGSLEYVRRGAERNVRLIAIDSHLEPVDVGGLTLDLREKKHVSVLTRQDNGVYRYQSVEKEYPRTTRPLEIRKAGTALTLPTDQAGDFVALVKDNGGTVLARLEYTVAGAANLSRSLERDGELLVKLDRSDYEAGQTIELQIQAPYSGSGLITIEREKVLAYKWFRASSSRSVESIRIPRNLEGNAYVNVAFIRGADSREIYVSPLSYAVAPFSISRQKRINALRLEAPERVYPGDTLKIGVNAHRAARAVVFAVDEGILQVARYRNPDPLTHFLKKRSLQVTSQQILDLILPEHRLVQLLSAAGGDMAELKLMGDAGNLNPFRRGTEQPAVYWSGIVPLEAGRRKELSYVVPDHFNGSLRIIAVAVNAETVGVETAAVAVRGHFVVNPNVPAFVAPGDSFTVTASVANNVEGSGAGARATVQLEPSEHLEASGPLSAELAVAEGREGTVQFRLKAKPSLGAARLRFKVSLGERASTRTVELSVRPAVPFFTTVASGAVLGSSVDVPVPRQLFAEYRTLEAGASTLPLTLARGLVRYLDRFPYGCTEQLVSQAVPALVLQGRPEFGFAPEDARKKLDAVIRILRSRQNSEGAFGFWAANSHASPFQSAYVAQFLTEARDAGYPVPPDLLSRALAFLRSFLEQQERQGPPENLENARLRAFAIYVLTRNGETRGRNLQALVQALESVDAKAKPALAAAWRGDLTGAYIASVYRMVKLEKEADGLVSQLAFRSAVEPPVEAYYEGEGFYDALLHNSGLLYLLARHFPERLGGLSGDEILRAFGPVLKESFNTLSSAYSIFALDAYADAVGAAKGGEVRIDQVDAEGKATPLVLPQGLFPTIPFSPDARRIQVHGQGPVNLFYQVIQAGFDRDLPTTAVQDGMEIQRDYLPVAGLPDAAPVASAGLGDELEVRIRVRALDRKWIPNLAIVDLLPGGFEPVLDSIRKGLEGEGDGSAVAPEPEPAPTSGPGGVPLFRPDHVDVREDRVLVFGSLGGEAREFRYRIKAVSRGEFAIPPAYGESMYDRGVRARRPGTEPAGGRLTVGDAATGGK